MMRHRPRSTLLSPHAQKFFACCLIIALGQACTTAEVATPEGPSDKGIISDNRPSASEAQSTTGQTSGMFTPDNPTVRTPTNNPGPVEQPNNQQPQQDQETTPTPQTPAVPNPEPPTHSNAPAQSESHSSEDGQFNWSGQLNPGQMVRVYNGTGDMVVTPTDGDQVEIVATKSSVNSDPESVSFRVVEGEFGLLICTIYPDAPGAIPPKCDTEAVTITQGENDVNVRYEIRIPSGLLADINTITGNIQGLELDIPFKGNAVNGNVTVSTSSFAIATAVNGDVDVSMGNPSDFLGEDEGIEFKTVTGQLTVTVPSDSSFDYEMSAVSRQIDSAFPYEMEGIGMSASGRAGNGGPFIGLSVVNGAISLLKAN